MKSPVLLIAALFALSMVFWGCAQPEEKTEGEEKKGGEQEAGKEAPGEEPTGEEGAGEPAGEGPAGEAGAEEPAEPEAAPPETADEPGPPETREETIDGSELQEKDGLLEYCLNCRRKSATYDYCLFEKADIEAAMGADYADKTTTTNLTMQKIAADNVVPSDPNSPQPDGGFTHNYYKCSVAGPAAP